MVELLLGIVCGIALSLFFSFGPSFFSQLQLSMQYGFKKSYFFAFGVSVGDVIIVGMMVTVLKNVDLFELLHNVYVASIGSAVMVGMGIHYLLKKVDTLENQESRIKFQNRKGDPNRKSIFAQGFVINFANPLIWLYWVSVVTLMTGELNLSITERYVFFIGVLATTLGLDVLKCKLASLLQRIITARIVNISNKVCGGMMFFFACGLLLSMVRYQTNSEYREQEQSSNPQSTEMIKKLHTLKDNDSTAFWRRSAAERDSLRAERDSLRAERDRLKAERDSLKAERDSAHAAHRKAAKARRAQRHNQH